jgi:hypothetical protein
MGRELMQTLCCASLIVVCDWLGRLSYKRLSNRLMPSYSGFKVSWLMPCANGTSVLPITSHPFIQQVNDQG